MKNINFDLRRGTDYSARLGTKKLLDQVVPKRSALYLRSNEVKPRFVLLLAIFPETAEWLEFLLDDGSGMT